MESFSQARNAARKRYHIAEHMLTQTYPLVRDPKLLLGVLQNAFGSAEASMTAWLRYEQEHGEIPAFTETFQGRLAAFQRYIAPKRNVQKEYLLMLAELREIMKEHEESPMEITKGEKMVIFDDKYHARKLTPSLLKDTLKQVRGFLFLMESKVTNDDAIIARRS